MTSNDTTSLHVRRSWKAMLRDEAEALAFARCWNTTNRSGPPIAVHPVALNGAAMLLRPGTTDAQVLDDTFVGMYHFPPQTLPEDALVLDLGGNVGHAAAHFATLCPRGRVICVEMDAANAALARENLKQFGDRCMVVHAAAWDSDGSLSYDGTEEWGFRVTTLEGETTTPRGGTPITAPAKTIETILRECGLPGASIDYAKIDIEGAEDRIVKPASAWLRNVRTIKVEHHPPASRESMAAALEAAGFVVRDDEKHQRCVVGVRG